MSDDIAKVDDTAKRTIWGRLIAFFFGIVFIVLVAEVVLRFVAAFLGDQFRSIGQMTLFPRYVEDVVFGDLELDTSPRPSALSIVGLPG